MQGRRTIHSVEEKDDFKYVHGCVSKALPELLFA